MADESADKPVTDSRFAGFNKEVEDSHAAAAAPAPAPAAAASPESAPRTKDDVARELLSAIVAHVGNPPLLQRLLAELFAPVPS